ncbi:MAG: hypothetical protein FWD69_16105 [Polyangiaceae bacterium]|nr:hypothetical protein [Polyangiaceae bacterium]
MNVRLVVPFLLAIIVIALVRAFSDAIVRRVKSPWRSLDTQRAMDIARSHRVRRHPRDVTAASIASALRERFTETIAVRCIAIAATRRLPPRRAVHWLRWALTDPAREVRACAASGLGHIQRKMDGQVAALSKALAKAEDRAHSAHLHLRLAEAHWEIAYAKLVDGVALGDAIASACEHASRACELLPGFASAEAFLGRMWLQLREARLAEAAFRRAISAGYPRTKLLPYLAECAFYKRDFPAVRHCLRELELCAPFNAFPRAITSFWF